MVRADFSTDCLGARGAAAKVAKLGGRKRAEVREAAAARRFADRCAMHAASAYHASELRASEADRCPGIPLPLRCDCYATVRRDLIARWTSSTPTELAFLTQPARCEEEGWGVCRPMQVTVRIRLPTAHDGRDWRVHRRSSPTAEVWNTAG